MLYSNFIQRVWFTPKSQIDSDLPARFRLQTIPYRFLDATLQGNLSEDDEVSLSISEFVMENCVVDYENIMTSHDRHYTLRHLDDLLPASVVAEIVEKALSLWSPDADFMSTLVTTVELMVDPRFADNTWHCKTCQAKGLDKQRNCPYLAEEQYDIMFKLPFMDDLITTCPVADKDEALGRILLEGYGIQELGSLPEEGGVGAQPILYVLGARHLAHRVKHFQRKAEEAARKT